MLTVVAAIMLWSVQTNSGVPALDTNMLLQFYDTGDRDIQLRVERHVKDIEDGLGWANSHLYANKQPLIYCAPEKIALQGAQLMDMLRREVKERPEMGTSPVGLVLLHTLRQVFPCKAN
jgi:hypothetical protein